MNSTIKVLRESFKSATNTERRQIKNKIRSNSRIVRRLRSQRKSCFKSESPVFKPFKPNPRPILKEEKEAISKLNVKIVHIQKKITRVRQIIKELEIKKTNSTKSEKPVIIRRIKVLKRTIVKLTKRVSSVKKIINQMTNPEEAEEPKPSKEVKNITKIFDAKVRKITQKITKMTKMIKNIKKRLVTVKKAQKPIYIRKISILKKRITILKKKVTSIKRTIKHIEHPETTSETKPVA